MMKFKKARPCRGKAGPYQNMTKELQYGIPIRENQVRDLLTRKGFKGEYLLVSTKQESVYYKRLVSLPADIRLIVDLYTPILLEKELTLSKWKPQDWLTRLRNKEMVRKFLRRGNHFLVANRRQKEYWLETSKQLGAPIIEIDISVFPTGSSSNIVRRPDTRHQTLNTILWFGGIYPWMDPYPLAEAFGKLAPKFPGWKLRFLGGWHPDTGYRGIYRKLEEFSRKIIPKNQLEFIPWQTEKNLNEYFNDAAFAVHLAKPTLEDYCAHRVRLLTLLDAGIGVLTSGRDIISDILVKSKAGMRIRRRDTERILIRAMNEPELRQKWSQNALKIEKIFVKQELDVDLFSYS